MEKKLSNFIKDSRLDELELELAKVNIFEILKLSSQEIRHSNFLAWLLDPSKNHNLQDNFLKRFLKDIFSEEKIPWITEFDVDGINTGDVIIYREYRNIDILIKTSHFLVVIENKVWSGEHSNQLETYRNVIDSSFPEIRDKTAYVYLTPYGEEPKKESDSEVYVPYSYKRIITILDDIIRIFGDNIANKTRNYIKDYIIIVKRYIMNDEKQIDLVRKIYENHKEALDYIFLNKPDRLLEVEKIFNKSVEKSGYVIGSRNKGYIKFLTPELDKIIPKKVHKQWTEGELFLFEIDFTTKKVYFRCIVAPGDQKIRDIIINALSKIDNAKTKRSPSWTTVHSHPYNLDINDANYSDSKLEKKFDDILLEEKKFIEEVEKKILSIAPEINRVQIDVEMGAD